MLEGLADPDRNCSRAATVMINSLLKERGAVLLEKASPTPSALPWQLPAASWPAFIRGALGFFHAHYAALACQSLSPLPPRQPAVR